MKRTIVIAAVVTLGLAACSSDGGGGSDLSDDQAAAASSAIEEAEAGGIELDEEGEALGLELLNCADEEALVDLFIAGMNESGEAFDEDCAREQLEGLDVADLAAASEGGDPPEELITALMECVDTGG